MCEVLLFPLGRAHGLVRTVAGSLADAAPEDRTEAWLRHARRLIEEIAGTVPNAVLDAELFRLLHASLFVADQKPVKRKPKASTSRAVRKLELVRPAQGDLFDRPVPSRILGRTPAAIFETLRQRPA